MIEITPGKMLGVQPVISLVAGNFHEPGLNQIRNEPYGKQHQESNPVITDFKTGKLYGVIIQNSRKGLNGYFRDQPCIMAKVDFSLEGSKFPASPDDHFLLKICGRLA